nr:MAG TPA: hypothetical protein [Caudoviricetes sp.]
MRITEIIQALTAALDGIQNTAVYTGTIPADVPLYRDGRTPKPYILLWVSQPTGIDAMRSVAGCADRDSQTLTIQTTLVGADVNTVMHLSEEVRGRLTGHAIGGHEVRPDEPQQQTAYPEFDTTTPPARAYVPLVWRLTTQ